LIIGQLQLHMFSAFMGGFKLWPVACQFEPLEKNKHYKTQETIWHETPLSKNCPIFLFVNCL